MAQVVIRRPATDGPRFDPRSLYVVFVKAIPLQAWTGSVGYRRLRLPDFKTISTWRW